MLNMLVFNLKSTTYLLLINNTCPILFILRKINQFCQDIFVKEELHTKKGYALYPDQR